MSAGGRTSDEAIAKRLGIPLGPAAKALFALVRESEDADDLGILGPGRALSFPIVWVKPSDIGDATRRLRPFASDHKSYYALSKHTGATDTDGCPVVLVDWGEGGGPRIVAGTLVDFLAQLAHDRPPAHIDKARHRRGQAKLRTIPGVTRAAAKRELPLELLLVDIEKP